MRKVCVYTSTRAEYGLLRNLIKDIHDSLEFQLQLLVTGTFSGDFNETLTATTNSSGVATFTTTRALRAGLSFQFCVDNVSYGMLPYEPQDNLETCDIY